MTFVKRSFLFVILASVLVLCTALGGDIKSAGKKGVWSADSTWVGAKPTAIDNVVIADGDTVTVDTTVAVASLTVGEGVSGGLVFTKVKTVVLTVTGNVLVKTGAIFRVQSRATVGVEVLDTLIVYGNLTSQGSAFDMRTGSAGSSLSVCNVIFTGSGNSIVTMGPYTTSNNEFNGVTINKSGSGRVILASDMVSGGGSSSQATGDPIWFMKRGIVETGNFAVIMLWTTEAGAALASDSCYFLGAMGRGMSNSGAASKVFHVGDANGYRPVRVHTAASGQATGHYVRVQCVSGDANAGATYSGGIDKVSAVRYFKVSYNRFSTGASSMTFDYANPSYGLDDGVAAGNTTLRIGYADSTKLVWKGLGPTTSIYTTALDSLPRRITGDTLALANQLSLIPGPGQSFYFALARLSGSVENSLSRPSGVERVSAVPSEFALKQNYPNPFNPSTTIRFALERSGFTTLSIYDLLGRLVGTIAEGNMQAGTYSVDWNASGLASGLYFYTLRSGENLQTRKMILMK